MDKHKKITIYVKKNEIIIKLISLTMFWRFIWILMKQLKHTQLGK